MNKPRQLPTVRHCLVFALTLAISISGAAGETPREFAKRFYGAHREWPIRGVPTTDQEDLVAPFLGKQITRAFRRVNEHRDLEAELLGPDSSIKPRWCLEGDVFCDNWEGITSFEIGKARKRGKRWVVEVHLSYVERESSRRWTDHLVLGRAKENWVVVDIKYSRGGTLLKELLRELAIADKEIPKPKRRKK